jgi:hypothetical protein
MTHDKTMQSAREHMAAYPEVFKKIKRPKGSGKGIRYGDAVEDMLLNLMDHFPELGDRSLATLLNVSREFTRYMRRKHESLDDEPDANVLSNTNFHAAMKLHHPGRVFEDDPAARFEDQGTMVVAFEQEKPRRVDQSHTAARPITLPTAPFKYSA